MVLPKQGAWVRPLERELDSTCHNEDPAMPLRPGSQINTLKKRVKFILKEKKELHRVHSRHPPKLDSGSPHRSYRGARNAEAERTLRQRERSQESLTVILSMFAEARLYGRGTFPPLFPSWADRVRSFRPICDRGDQSHAKSEFCGNNPPRASRGSSSQVPGRLSPETQGFLFTRGQVRLG